VTSAARTAANRQNATRSTGPKSKQGKARSASNARKYGFTARVLDGTPEAGRITDLALAFLGELPRTQEAWSLAMAAAEAQYQLQLIRSYGHRLLVNTEADPETFRGPHRRTDSVLIRDTLDAHSKGATDVGSPALRDFWFRMRREAPRDHVKRHTELLLLLAADLKKIDQYWARAGARRRRSVRELDAYRLRLQPTPSA
jgi:hypothetical protein